MCYNQSIWNLTVVFSIFSSLPAFFRLVFQPFMSAQTIFLIGAWKPSGLDYSSLLTAAYPIPQRSKQDEWSHKVEWVTRNIKKINSEIKLKKFVLSYQSFLSDIKISTRKTSKIFKIRFFKARAREREISAMTSETNLTMAEVIFHQLSSQPRITESE